VRRASPSISHSPGRSSRDGRCSQTRRCRSGRRSQTCAATTASLASNPSPSRPRGRSRRDRCRVRAHRLRSPDTRRQSHDQRRRPPPYQPGSSPRSRARMRSAASIPWRITSALRRQARRPGRRRQSPHFAHCSWSCLIVSIVAEQSAQSTQQNAAAGVLDYP